MNFNPLGNFDVTLPVNPSALAESKLYLMHLPTCPSNSIRRIYGHWTVGHFNQDFPDYNGSVAFDGKHFHLHIPHDPRDNAIGVNNNTPASHTYQRNTGAFGIATDDMVFATTHDFGAEGVTMLAVEYLCAGIAAVAKKYNIDLTGTVQSGPFKGEHTFLTHAEAADHPGAPPQYQPYGPATTFERWDFLTLVPIPQGVSFTDSSVVGSALRTRAHAYKVKL